MFTHFKIRRCITETRQMIAKSKNPNYKPPFNWIYWLYDYLDDHINFHKVERELDKVKRIFFPLHKSLRKTIPRTWRDLDAIIEDFLFAAIVSFVEEEKGLERWVTDYSDYPNGGEEITKLEIENKAKIQEIYNYAKSRNWESGGDNQKQETEYLKEIIKLRKYLWT